MGSMRSENADHRAERVDLMSSTQAALFHRHIPHALPLCVQPFCFVLRILARTERQRCSLRFAAAKTQGTLESSQPHDKTKSGTQRCNRR